MRGKRAKELRRLARQATVGALERAYFIKDLPRQPGQEGGRPPRRLQLHPKTTRAANRRAKSGYKRVQSGKRP